MREGLKKVFESHVGRIRGLRCSVLTVGSRRRRWEFGRG